MQVCAAQLEHFVTLVGRERLTWAVSSFSAWPILAAIAAISVGTRFARIFLPWSFALTKITRQQIRNSKTLSRVNHRARRLRAGLHRSSTPTIRSANACATARALHPVAAEAGRVIRDGDPGR